MERFNPILAGAYQAHLDIACSKGDKRLNKRSVFVQALALLFVQQTACRLALPPLGATCAQICCASKGLPIEALAKTPFAQKQSFCEAYKSSSCKQPLGLQLEDLQALHSLRLYKPVGFVRSKPGDTTVQKRSFCQGFCKGVCKAAICRQSLSKSVSTLVKPMRTKPQVL